MLARRVKIRLQHHRKALFIHRIRDGVLVSTINPLPGHVSSRQFSLSTITEPINRAMETLPLPLQYNIPESILSLSETWVPAGLPTYTTGIVVFAILTRLCVFTPWSYWARKRKWRVQELVRPQAIAEMVFGWGPHLRKRLEKAGVTPQERRAIINENLVLRAEELEKKYKCTKWPTFIIPTAITLPAFIIASSIAYSAASLPAIAANPNMTEFFLMPDVAPYIPIALGALSMLSVEIGTLSPRTMQAMGKMDPKDAEVAAKKLEVGDTTPTDKVLEFKPNLFVQSTFRVLSLGRAAICVGLPGTVNILWFTSTLVGSIEALIFTSIERSRAPRHWGRNSRLFLEPRAKLEERGFDLSPISPLERVGKANYSLKGPSPTIRTQSNIERTASNALLTGLNASESAVKMVKTAKARTVISIARTQTKVHDVVVVAPAEMIDKTKSFVAPKFDKFLNFGFKDLGEWRKEAWEMVCERTNIKIDKMEAWLKIQPREKRLAKRKARAAKPRQYITAQDLSRKKRKRQQWLYVLSQLNQAKADEARRETRMIAAQEAAAKSLPGLVPQRPKHVGEKSTSLKPLIN